MRTATCSGRVAMAMNKELVTYGTTEYLHMSESTLRCLMLGAETLSEFWVCKIKYHQVSRWKALAGSRA